MDMAVKEMRVAQRYYDPQTGEERYITADEIESLISDGKKPEEIKEQYPQLLDRTLAAFLYKNSSRYGALFEDWQRSTMKRTDFRIVVDHSAFVPFSPQFCHYLQDQFGYTRTLEEFLGRKITKGHGWINRAFADVVRHENAGGVDIVIFRDYYGAPIDAQIDHEKERVTTRGSRLSNLSRKAEMLAIEFGIAGNPAIEENPEVPAAVSIHWDRQESEFMLYGRVIGMRALLSQVKKEGVKVVYMGAGVSTYPYTIDCSMY